METLQLTKGTQQLPVDAQKQENLNPESTNKQDGEY